MEIITGSLPDFAEAGAGNRCSRLTRYPEAERNRWSRPPGS